MSAIKDDPGLVERLRQPESCRAAFADVMRTYGPPLYHQIRRIVQTHEDADDLLQNTFVKAWQNLEYFRGDAKLSTWLFKIATNESLTFLAKERVRANVDIEDDSYLIENIQADEWFDGDELQANLQKAISKLPEKQRLIFNMRYFDEMKYEDISDILGTTVGALKASYHHAVKKIESFFESL